MAQIENKYPTMTLYADPRSPITHWLIMVIAEKRIMPNIVFVDPKKIPSELSRMNPNNILPFWVERQALIVRMADLMAEYLEERFPVPQLLPGDPKDRVKHRQAIKQITEGWYSVLHHIETEKNRSEAIHTLQQCLKDIAPIFRAQPYFLSEECTLVDCCIAPVLSRLKQLNLDLVSEINTLADYQSRLFELESFKKSLQQIEMHIDDANLDL